MKHGGGHQSDASTAEHYINHRFGDHSHSLIEINLDAVCVAFISHRFRSLVHGADVLPFESVENALVPDGPSRTNHRCVILTWTVRGHRFAEHPDIRCDYGI